MKTIGVLVKPEGNGALLITQQAHAFVSGQLARAWGNDRFEPPSPRREVCLAAEQHDLGMASFDLDPDIDPDSGLPVSFMEMPLERHLAVWTAGPRRMLAQDRYAAMLVASHGIALYERRTHKPPEVIAYIERQRAFVDELAVGLGVSEEELRRNQRLIWAFDSLSLALLLDWDPFSLDHFGIERRGHVLDPWPFAHDELTLGCDARRHGQGWERVEITLAAR